MKVSPADPRVSVAGAWWFPGGFWWVGDSLVTAKLVARCADVGLLGGQGVVVVEVVQRRHKEV